MAKKITEKTPEESATAMRDLTRALPDINQVPDSGRCYHQCVEGDPEEAEEDNRVGVPQDATD